MADQQHAEAPKQIERVRAPQIGAPAPPGLDALLQRTATTGYRQARRDPRTLAPATLLALQRTAGNAAVNHLVRQQQSRRVGPAVQLAPATAGMHDSSPDLAMHSNTGPLQRKITVRDGTIHDGAKETASVRDIIEAKAPDRWDDALIEQQAGRGAPLDRGPVSVQRLLMTGAQLKAQAGEPKENKTVDLPLMDTITLRNMSTRYRAVLDSLGAYHSYIADTVIATDIAARGKQVSAIEERLKAVEDDADVYTTEHQKSSTKAAKKLKKLETKEKVKASAKPNKDLEELREETKRFKAVGDLKVQVAADRRDARNLHQLGWHDVEVVWKAALLGASPDLIGNPAEMVDEKAGDPTAAITQHQAPALGAGTYRTGQRPAAAARGGFVMAGRPMDVTVVPQGKTFDPATPDQVPAATDLYTVGQGTKVHLTNSLKSPVTQEDLDPAAIFINSPPTPDDVTQGAIGDCYFLATVNSILGKDPQRIPAMMRVSGTNVRVRFMRYDTGEHVWRPQIVEVDRTLAQPTGGGSLQFAQARVANTPSKAHWEARVTPAANAQQPGQLTIHRHNWYRAAFWAPLLEKAYARFAQDYGRYGNGPGTPDSSTTTTTGAPRSGYNVINEGGQEYLAMGIFYGQTFTSGQNLTRGSYTPDLNAVNNKNVLDNRAAIELLLQFQGKEVPTGKTALMTVSNDREELAKRCGAIIDTFLAGTGAQSALHTSAANELGLLRTELQDLRQAIRTWEPTRASLSKDAGEAAIAGFATKAGAIANPAAAWKDVLHQPAAQQDLVAMLLESLTTVMHTTDTSTGQRFIYGQHAYTVERVVLRDQQGADLDLAPSSLSDQQLRAIDAGKSRVGLRNPHHANTPNPHGTGETGTDGAFELSLDQMLRAFRDWSHAIVPTR